MRLLFLSGILILNIAAFGAQQTVHNDKSKSIYPADAFSRRLSVVRIINGAAKFSDKLVQEVAKHDRNNLIVSPLGAYLALGMTSFGAREYTEFVFRNVLGLSYSQYKRKVGFQTVIDQLNSYKSVELHVANGVFVSSDIQPHPQFIEATTNAFRSSVQAVDFNKSQQAAKIINEWCEEKTHGRIQELVNADGLDGSTKLILVNALYFKGTWLKQFNVENTVRRSFIRDDGILKQVRYMTGLLNIRYGEYPEVQAHFIELPYLSENSAHNMSMFVILPDETTGLAHLEKNFHTITVEKLISRGEFSDVDVYLPKFKIESKIELNEPLIRMKMDNLFKQYKANFSGMFKPAKSANNRVFAPREKLAISKVVQKAFIEINEAGSEAAAATEIDLSWRMGGGPFIPPFIANHPFYAIIATTGENPLNLFTVRYTGQEE